MINYYSLTLHLISHHFFLAQELSNTAWALATLHSKRKANTATEAIEDDGIVRLLRWVAKFLLKRVDTFKPQEISNR